MDVTPGPFPFIPIRGGDDEPVIVLQGAHISVHFQTWVFAARKSQGGYFHMRRNLTIVVTSGRGVCAYCLVDAEDDDSNVRMVSPIIEAKLDRNRGIYLPAYTAYELTFDPGSVLVIHSDTPFDPTDEHRVEFFLARFTTHD